MAVCVNIIVIGEKKLLFLSIVVNNVINTESFTVEVQQCFTSTAQPTVWRTLRSSCWMSKPGSSSKDFFFRSPPYQIWRKPLPVGTTMTHMKKRTDALTHMYITKLAGVFRNSLERAQKILTLNDYFISHCVRNNMNVLRNSCSVSDIFFSDFNWIWSFLLDFCKNS